jgi:hypothetical protein
MNTPILYISNLTRIYTCSTSKLPRLSMAEVTGYEEFTTFKEVRDHILETLRYPQPHKNKHECFGWVPTLYEPSEREFTNRATGTKFTRDGCWRNAAAEADSLSVFYADVDNNEASHPTVTMQAVAANLDALGWPIRYFMYTSYSDTEAKSKFRVVVEIDRYISRTEMLRLGMYLNAAAFGQQADLSIYDAGDFIFAPPYGTTVVERMDGVPLPVDAILAQQANQQEQTPGYWDSYIQVKQPKRSSTQPPAERSRALESQRADSSTRPGFDISNPAVFNPAWIDLYKNKASGDSHWETMRSLLGMVWAKTRGGLSYGEMDRLLRQIDATDGHYFAFQHGETKIADLITFIMNLPVEDDERDWSPILDEDDSGLTIRAKEGECGEGKTRDELQRMAHEKGRYVYVVDKIENIEKRRQEFFELAGKLTAIKFFVREAHSKNEGLRVPLQLHGIRQDLNKEPAGRPAIIFVTQQGAMQMDWSRWGDCEVILDEVPDIFSVYKIKVKNHAGVLQRYIHTSEEDGNCYLLGLTNAGEELARTMDIDDYDAVHHGLCVMMAKPNTLVWVKKKGWDDPTEGGKLEFFAITSPLNLRPFSKVWMLGDELTKSVTAKVWSQKWGVKFEPVAFEKRHRIVPTKDRVSIYYFSDHRDSSLTRFKEGDLPLPAMTEWIKEHAGMERVLWTSNEKLKDRSKLDSADYISPKAHGRNDLQHYTRVAWLAAMKASKFEIGTLREVCGMSAQDLTDWREYNTLYQFVMRCILRDFGSAVPVVIYVFSRKQAEYLQQRLGGSIHKVGGVIVDEPVRCVDQDGAMSASERQKVKYWRDKMVNAGVENVRLLPKSSKLTEREVRLVNATFQRRADDNRVDEDRRAA